MLSSHSAIKEHNFDYSNSKVPKKKKNLENINSRND